MIVIYKPLITSSLFMKELECKLFFNKANGQAVIILPKKQMKDVFRLNPKPKMFTIKEYEVK